LKNNLNVVFVPEPGNDGTDMNWIEYAVIGHEDPAMISKEAIDKLSKSFWSDERRTIYFEDDGPMDERCSAQALLDHAEELGYTVFPLVGGIAWLDLPQPLPLVAT
jgi:glycine/D-amino acid oxidase-like deaminating enzyme